MILLNTYLRLLFLYPIYLFIIIIYDDSEVFTFLFVVAGFYMNIEINTMTGTSLKFHETIYFLVVTMATVGYGDIHPTTASGMITITLAICIGAIILIPYYVSKLTERISDYSPYRQNLPQLQGRINAIVKQEKRL